MAFMALSIISKFLYDRMKVKKDGEFLFYITADNFIDSAEWFAATEPSSSSPLEFKVTHEIFNSP